MTWNVFILLWYRTSARDCHSDQRQISFRWCHSWRLKQLRWAQNHQLICKRSFNIKNRNIHSKYDSTNRNICRADWNATTTSQIIRQWHVRRYTLLRHDFISCAKAKWAKEWVPAFWDSGDLLGFQENNYFVSHPCHINNKKKERSKPVNLMVNVAATFESYLKVLPCSTNSARRHKRFFLLKKKSSNHVSTCSKKQ